jgi:hypothetical protein
MTGVITAHDKHRAILREIEMRRSVHPRRIATGSMTKQQADREIAVMEAIAADYEKLAEGATAVTEGEIERYEPEFWDIGEEQHADATRKLVDQEVGEALADYIRNNGRFSIDYRMGGSPTVSFYVATDDFEPIPGASFQRDLGDLLLSEIKTTDTPHEMVDLLQALFQVYERWRADRLESDPNCNIPTPAVDEDDDPLDRSEDRDA